MRVWKLCLSIGMRVRMQMMCSIEMCARGHIKPGDTVAPSPIRLPGNGIAAMDSMQELTYQRLFQPATMRISHWEINCWPIPFSRK